MSLSLGNAIAVSTNFIKSNPAVPVYKGEENPNNLYAVIYHIEIGYSEVASQKTKQEFKYSASTFCLSTVHTLQSSSVTATSANLSIFSSFCFFK